MYDHSMNILEFLPFTSAWFLTNIQKTSIILKQWVSLWVSSSLPSPPPPPHPPAQKSHMKVNQLSISLWYACHFAKTKHTSSADKWKIRNRSWFRIAIYSHYKIKMWFSFSLLQGLMWSKQKTSLSNSFRVKNQWFQGILIWQNKSDAIFYRARLQKTNKQKNPILPANTTVHF